ncbi:hypothetical protein JCM19239_634 [Vibrio variabilis]|uniref:Uncharacterized protein n=1 Tax=Vibrio variabilis TaxID=990271 RepID=A0ABQ0JRT7_9VIBR|nr:hypothetical protein JCM19239_634 [Vibrio variabilis]
MSKLFVSVLVSSVSFAAFASPEYSANVPEEIITPDSVQSIYLGEMEYTTGARLSNLHQSA